jgi:DNA-binding response OmpR family regulator
VSDTSATILVVDDNPDALFMLHRLLGRQGYRVRTAAGGRAALMVLAAELVDVIVLDVMMPDMNGLAVCRVLRQDPRLSRIPVILLTASDEADTRIAAMSLGVSEFVTKPVDTRDFGARIRAQLHQRQLASRVEDLLSR